MDRNVVLSSISAKSPIIVKNMPLLPEKRKQTGHVVSVKSNQYKCASTGLDRVDIFFLTWNCFTLVDVHALVGVDVLEESCSAI